MKTNNFDRIAPFYDALTILFFGGAIQRAQRQLLHLISEKSNVLILGGGTGWIAEELLKKNPSVHITYIDASQKMIDIAKQKVSSKQVEYISGTETSIPDRMFDVVITAFFLDIFSSHELNNISDKIISHLKPKAVWLATDFVQHTWWHKTYLFVMYQIFRIIANIKTEHLPPWQDILSRRSTLIASKKFFFGFIVTAAYQVK